MGERYTDTRGTRHEVHEIDDGVVVSLYHEGGLVTYVLGAEQAKALAREIEQAA